MAASSASIKKGGLSRGPWTPDEDRKIVEDVALHGAKKWTTIAAKSGLSRCAKSCRLRWMNYLRPNIKRGNMCDQEEDLIIRLHKLLGNRWSLIAARLPGRTDNEIKNYWNHHLSKKSLEETVMVAGFSSGETRSNSDLTAEEKETTSVSSKSVENSGESEAKVDDFDDFFDFSNENPSTLEWVNKFIEFGNTSC